MFTDLIFAAPEGLPVSPDPAPPVQIGGGDPLVKECRRCLVVKGLEEFSPHPSTALGRMQVCKACRAEAGRLFRAANKKPRRVPVKAICLDGRKTCRKCGEHKPLGEFSPNKLGRFGVNSWCRVCRRDGRPPRPPPKEKKPRAPVPAVAPETRRCSKCQQVKPLDRFVRNKSCRWGRTGCCSECQLKYANKYRENNREKSRAANRRWASRNVEREKARQHKRYHENWERERARHKKWGLENPETLRAQGARRRAREAGAPGWGYTTAQHIRWRWQVYGNKCYLCGAPATCTDHVIPLARGGSHWPANLRPACGHCNPSKHAKPLGEFLEYLSSVKEVAEVGPYPTPAVKEELTNV